MTPNPKSFLDFINSFQSKHIRIGLVSGLSYVTSNLQVLNETSVIFTDIKGNRVMITIDQINRIEEIKR